MAMPIGLIAFCSFVCLLLKRIWPTQKAPEEKHSKAVAPLADRNDKGGNTNAIADSCATADANTDAIADSCVSAILNANAHLHSAAITNANHVIAYAIANARTASIDSINNLIADARAKNAANYHVVVAKRLDFIAKTSNLLGTVNDKFARRNNAIANTDDTTAVADKAIVNARNAIAHANNTITVADRVIIVITAANAAKAMATDGIFGIRDNNVIADAESALSDAVANGTAAIANAKDALAHAANTVAHATHHAAASHAISVIIGQHHCQLQSDNVIPSKNER